MSWLSVGVEEEAVAFAEGGFAGLLHAVAVEVAAEEVWAGEVGGCEELVFGGGSDGVSAVVEGDGVSGFDVEYGDCDCGLLGVAEVWCSFGEVCEVSSFVHGVEVVGAGDVVEEEVCGDVEYCGDLCDFGECGLSFAAFDSGHYGLGEAELLCELALGGFALDSEEFDFEPGGHGFSPFLKQ